MCSKTSLPTFQVPKKRWQRKRRVMSCPRPPGMGTAIFSSKVGAPKSLLAEGQLVLAVRSRGWPTPLGEEVF